MFSLTSSAFPAGGAIPSRYTCKGVDQSPPLAWTGLPTGTRSLTLIVDDPDAPDPAAPTRVWVHWIRYNIPARSIALADGAGNRAAEDGATDAITDGGTTGYHGPCPPVGRHRYFFRLSALDVLMPDLGPHARRTDVERAMRGHVLGTTELMGTYERPID